MAVENWHKHLVASGVVLALAIGMLLSNLGIGANQNKKASLAEAKFYGAASCFRCHADDTPEGKPRKWPNDLVLMNEFLTWRTKDKHALAFAVLQGERGQRIGELLKINVTKDAKCLNCHATTSRPERHGENYSNIDGVSCDGCHGPAENWMTPHAFPESGSRKKTPEEKESLGMFDVRNPVKKAQMCMSCHVGNASEGKVVTHAMYAAGHPPLPSFEVASFCGNLPQHWRNIQEVPYFKDKKTSAKIRNQNYGEDAEFQNTKMVLATGVESMRLMMELVANRATFEGKPKTREYGWPPAWLLPHAKNEAQDRWPELAKDVNNPKPEELHALWPEIAMAQSDCFACHHDLKSASWRQLRGYPGKPGRPQFQPWPFALSSIVFAGADEDRKLAAKVKNLSRALDSNPFGVPKEVAAAAMDLELFSDNMINPLSKINRDLAEKLLKRLLVKGTSSYADYDSVRQIAWATRMVFSDWAKGHPQQKSIEEIFVKLDNELSLTLQSNARGRFVEERYKLTKDLALVTEPAMIVEEFTKKASNKDFLNSLQKNSDQELAVALERVGNYSPTVFKTRMNELDNLIFPKK